MKLRVLKLTLEQFTGLLQGKLSFPARLPNDLEVLDAKVDLFTKQVNLVIRSDSFEDVDESSPVPELVLSATPAEPAAVTSPVPDAPAKPDIPVQTAEQKNEGPSAVARAAPPPLSRYAAKMENEFTPEQRKLLSFTVKGDAVVVKPVTFLKAEWDDINDVVRSLGGRWVKGDIISYWEIPLQ